jgi:hypothetical protein
MRLMVRGFAVAAALCVATGTAQAADGLLIVQKTTIGGGAPQTNQIQIEARRMRAESTGATGGKQIVMFDSAKQVMTLVDPERKTYTEITQAEVEKLSAQMSGAMAQMQQQMAGLPPEQRAQIEAMMKKSGAPTAAPAKKTQYRKVGTDTVGKWKCDKYDGYDGETKTSELCTVDPKALGFAPTDLEISKQLAAFFGKLAPQRADQMFAVGTPEVQGYSGVPVRQMITIAGRQITTEITEASRQNFSDASYQVPAGFAKTDFMGARGRPRIPNP